MLDEKKRIKKLNEIQDEIVEKHWDKEAATYDLCTSFGKTFFSLKIIKKKLEKDQLKKGGSIAFLSEVSIRPDTVFLPDFEKFNSIYKWNVFDYFEIDFHCYQAVPNLSKYALVVYDEADEVCTPQRYRLLSSFKGVQKVLLTGTPREETNVFDLSEEDLIDFKHNDFNIYQSDSDTEEKRITQYVTKGQMYEMFAPIVERVPLIKMIKEGILSNYKTTVITHNLSRVGKPHRIWAAKKNKKATYGSEFKYFTTRYEWAKQLWKEPIEYKKMVLFQELPRFVWDLPSKIPVCKGLKDMLESDPNNKILWVAKSATQLRQFLDEDQLCVRQYPHPNKKNKMKSKSNKVIQKILNKFEKGDLQSIGTSQLLKKGLSVPAINVIVFHSYDSKSGSFWQFIGRGVRFKKGKTAKIILLRTNGTFEELSWFDKLSEFRDSKGKLIRTVDLNVTKITDSRQVILKHKQLKDETKT